jgi:hypothetical protein
MGTTSKTFVRRCYEAGDEMGIVQDLYRGSVKGLARRAPSFLAIFDACTNHREVCGRRFISSHRWRHAAVFDSYMPTSMSGAMRANFPIRDRSEAHKSHLPLRSSVDERRTVPATPFNIRESSRLALPEHK